MVIETINPATGKRIQSYDTMSDEVVANKIDAAHMAYQIWREVPVSERAAVHNRVADYLEENEERFARLMTSEMGKPIAQSRAEVEKCATLARYYATETENYLAPKIVETEMKKSFVTYCPIGVIFAIMPWNYPLWQVLRFSVVNLMAGNACILKHAPNCTGVALAIEEMYQACGLPCNLFNTIVIDVPQAENVIAHHHIAGVTLTGSERAGKSVAKQAGENLKKVVLELGGSDPFLVLEDADLDLAATVCVTSRLANAGQVCISAKRVIIVDAVRNAFIEKVKSEIAEYTVGDPMDELFKMGPLAREDLREIVHAQVQECVKGGATLIMGGEMSEAPGFFYPITVLDNVKKGMPAFDQEIFGPVIAFISAKDEEDAIRIANDTRYGLGASVFTKDVSRGEKIAVESLHAGMVSVNRLVGSDQRLPFGGIKASGFGRELSGVGMHEFMNIKTVCID